MDESDLSWNMISNLRWLADQPTRPGRVPCGMLTGQFLMECATRWEGDIHARLKAQEKQG